MKGQKKLKKKYLDILESLDWSICGYYDDGNVELEKYSPAGEDFTMYVEVEDFPQAVAEYARDFDVDEHAELWANSRGKRGVPGTIRELLDDAEAIQDMLNELADALEEKPAKKAKKAAAMYVVTVAKTGCLYVEANSAEEALEIASERPTEDILWDDSWATTDAEVAD